jgi:predicted Zn-dependent protease
MLDHGGNVDVALSLAQTARQKMPDQPAIADTLAWAYYRKGAYQAAIDLLEDAIKKAPQDPDIQYHLGLAYKSVNDGARAKSHLERVLQLNPKYPQADQVRQALSELGKT